MHDFHLKPIVCMVWLQGFCRFACAPQSCILCKESGASCWSPRVSQSFMCSYGLELFRSPCSQNCLPSIINYRRWSQSRRPYLMATYSYNWEHIQVKERWTKGWHEWYRDGEQAERYFFNACYVTVILVVLNFWLITLLIIRTFDVWPSRYSFGRISWGKIIWFNQNFFWFLERCLSFRSIRQKWKETSKTVLADSWIPQYFGLSLVYLYIVCWTCCKNSIYNINVVNVP